jgi:hypothetical protein
MIGYLSFEQAIMRFKVSLASEIRNNKLCSLSKYIEILLLDDLASVSIQMRPFFPRLTKLDKRTIFLMNRAKYVGTQTHRKPYFTRVKLPN